MFTIPLQLPSGEVVRLKEIKNRNLFDIIKFCLANDLEGLSTYLNDVIFSQLKHLSIVDKLYILIYLRSFSLGFDIMITDNIPGNPQVVYDLLNTIDEIEKLEVDYEKNIEVGDFKVILDIPTDLFYKTPDEIYFNIIKGVVTENETILLNELSLNDKEQIISCLPPTIIGELGKYITYLNERLGNITMISGGKLSNIKDIKMNLVSNQPLVFIQSIFSHDLSSFMQFMYQFVNKVGGTFNDFFDLTINDTKLMLDFYKEEIEKQNDELKRNQPRIK